MITIMKFVVAICVLVSLTAFTVVAVAGAKGTASAVVLTVPGPQTPCVHVEIQACTSCSRVGMLDIECKDGGDFRLCSTDYFVCQNGAQCDQHVASGTCVQ